MKRYTFFTDDYPVVTCNHCYEDQNENYTGPAIDRLAEYEATGLMPAEVAALQYQLKHIRRGLDVVEVVHAHWDEWWPGNCALIMTGEEMLYQCSACTAKFSDVEGFRHCPHCGAFMDGGNADGKE